MTTEIEKQFFECFGIEPKTLDYPDNFEYYPEITAEKLLELIRIIGDNFGFLYVNNTYSTNFNFKINSKKDLIMVETDDFKNGVLTLILQPKVLIRINREAVRKLFEEGKDAR